VVRSGADARGDAREDGTIAIVEGDYAQTLRIDHEHVRVIAHSSRYLAVGSSDGMVFWWDLAATMPHSAPASRGTSPCAMDATRIVTSAQETISVVDRTTLAARPIARLLGARRASLRQGACRRWPRSAGWSRSTS